MNTILHCENPKKDVYEHDTGESGLLADGFSAVLVQMRGDSVFFPEVLHFHKLNEVFNMCWICKAGLNHNRYTDASDSAGWRPTIRTMDSYLAELAAKGAPIPPLFKYVVGFQIQHVMIDVLHAIDRGVAAHSVGTIIVKCVQCFCGNDQKRIRVSSQELKLCIPTNGWAFTR